MVLMTIIPKMGEDQIGRHARFQRLEEIFNGSPFKGKVTIPELFDEDLYLARIPKENASAAFCFGSSLALRGEHHPPYSEFGPQAGKFPNRGAATDFDVIGMRPEAQNCLHGVKVDFYHISEMRRFGWPRIVVPGLEQSWVYDSATEPTALFPAQMRRQDPVFL